MFLMQQINTYKKVHRYLFLLVLIMALEVLVIGLQRVFGCKMLRLLLLLVMNLFTEVTWFFLVLCLWNLRKVIVLIVLALLVKKLSLLNLILTSLLVWMLLSMYREVLLINSL